MMLSWRKLALSGCLPILMAGASAACTASTEQVDSSADELNYRSTAGQEYSLSAVVRVAASPDIDALVGQAKTDALKKRGDELRNAVTTAIVAELDKIWPEDQRTTGAGIAIEFRQSTATSSELVPSGEGHYAMTVTGEFAGVTDLSKKLPQKTAADGTLYFPVSADLGSGAVNLQVVLAPITRSLNAYPRYLDMFKDGLDVAVHVGGDHDDPPQDIDHARSVYDDLVAAGFTSPVKTFEDLKIDSGPLTSSMKVSGDVVPVRVSIFHVDMSTPDTRQVLVDAYKKSVKNADVIIYDGHAGRQLDYSGVVVAYKPARVALPAAEFKNIDATDKQQVYLFNGCETYTGYADMLYLNPKRNPGNTDIITTGNFSAIQSKANQVITFIHSLVDQPGGAWMPRSWDSVLSRMNRVGERSWVHVYGVHGVDDNPKLSPLADASKIGAACRVDADCGAADSKCLQASSSKRVCGAACADTAGCPDGTKCVLPKGKISPDDLQCSAH